MSDCFKLNDERCEELRLLGADGTNGVDLYTSDGGVARGVDISVVVSSYLHEASGSRFHLHPELVDESGGEPRVMLCHHCVDKVKPPKMSIANHIDYGVLSRIDFPLEQPSDLEVMLISNVRLYHMVIKVSSKQGRVGREILKGDLIYFPHDGQEEVLKSLARTDTMMERVKWLTCDFKIMFLGPEGKRDALGKWLLSSTNLLARPHVIYNHLRIFNLLDEVMQIPANDRHAVPSIDEI